MLPAATALAGVVGFPTLLVLTRTDAFQQAMNGLFADISRMLSSALAPAADGIGSSLLAPILQPARLRAMSEAYLTAQPPCGLHGPAHLLLVGGAGTAARAPAFFGIQPWLPILPLPPGELVAVATHRIGRAGSGGPVLRRFFVGIRRLEHRAGPAFSFRPAGHGDRAGSCSRSITCRGCSGCSSSWGSRSSRRPPASGC